MVHEVPRANHRKLLGRSSFTSNCSSQGDFRSNMSEDLINSTHKKIRQALKLAARMGPKRDLLGDEDR